MRRLALLTVTCAVIGALLLIGSAAGPVATDESGETVTMYRAADVDLDEFDDAEDVERAVTDGTLQNVSGMLETETLVVEIEDAKLAEYADPNGDSSAAFFASLEAADRSLKLEQTNPTPQVNAREIPLGPENTTIYRIADVAYAVVEPSIHDEHDVRERERYGIAFDDELWFDPDGRRS